MDESNLRYQHTVNKHIFYEVEIRSESMSNETIIKQKMIHKKEAKEK